MRKNPTVVAGWSTVTPVIDALAICAATCRTNIAWRAGPTELQVFGLLPTGEAVPVGLPSAYTYR